MSSLANLLKYDSSDNEVVIGEIVSRSVEDKYKIKIGEREFIAVSLLPTVLPEKARVVVARIKGEVFITSREKIRDQQLLEVTING